MVDRTRGIVLEWVDRGGGVKKKGNVGTNKEQMRALRRLPRAVLTYKGLRSREGSASTSKGAGQVADSPGFDAREGWQSGLQVACRCLGTNKEQMRALHGRWRRTTVVRSRPLKTRGQPVALFKVHTFQALMWKEMPIFCATTTGTTSMLPRLPACGVADAQAICSARR